MFCGTGAAHPQCAVPGVHQAGGRAHDGPQGGVEVDYEGALPNSLVGGPPADVDRSVSINIPSEEAALGIETLLMGYVGPTAQAYDYSAPCSGT